MPGVEYFKNFSSFHTFTPADLKKSVGFYIDLTDGRFFNEVIYPDFPAPVLRNNLDGPELGISRWGMPSPDKAVKHKNDKGNPSQKPSPF